MKPIFVLFALALVVGTFANPSFSNNYYFHISSPTGATTWATGSTQQTSFWSNELHFTIQITLVKLEHGEYHYIDHVADVSIGTGTATYNVPSYLSGDDYYFRYSGYNLLTFAGPIKIVKVKGDGDGDGFADAFGYHQQHGDEHAAPSPSPIVNDVHQDSPTASVNDVHQHDSPTPTPSTSVDVHDHHDTTSTSAPDPEWSNKMHISSPLKDATYAPGSSQVVGWWVGWNYTTQSKAETFTIKLMKSENSQLTEVLVISSGCHVDAGYVYYTIPQSCSGTYVISFIGTTFTGNSDVFNIKA